MVDGIFFKLKQLMRRVEIIFYVDLKMLYDYSRSLLKVKQRFFKMMFMVIIIIVIIIYFNEMIGKEIDCFKKRV